MSANAAVVYRTLAQNANLQWAVDRSQGQSRGRIDRVMKDQDIERQAPFDMVAKATATRSLDQDVGPVGHGGEEASLLLARSAAYRATARQILQVTQAGQLS
jgi:hypothetical protein